MAVESDPLTAALQYRAERQGIVVQPPDMQRYFPNLTPALNPPRKELDKPQQAAGSTRLKVLLSKDTYEPFTDTHLLLAAKCAAAVQHACVEAQRAPATAFDRDAAGPRVVRRKVSVCAGPQRSFCGCFRGNSCTRASFPD
jgi:hypothetical protein